MMRKTIAFVALLMTFFFYCNAQTATSNATNEKPYIEVVGTNSIEVTPDMLYISITLREKKSLSIDAQEDTLKKIVQACGIPMSKLTINRAQSTYSKISFASRSGVTQKVYSLLLSDAISMGIVFDEFEKSTVIDNYRLDKISHTKMDSLEREVKIKAIKDAKIQAEYLLAAINEKLGKPMEIREGNKDFSQMYTITGGVAAKYGEDFDRISSRSTEISVQNIKIQKYIYIKFEIQ